MIVHGHLPDGTIKKRLQIACCNAEWRIGRFRDDVELAQAYLPPAHMAIFYIAM